MTIEICKQRFDPWLEIAKYQDKHFKQTNDCGATSVFVGSMRDFNENTTVSNMYLEHYPEMTEHQLGLIVNQALNQWIILDSLIIHRVGHITPSETIVLVAVWASHRGDAFDASRFIMEQLKSTAPFWKKETFKESELSRWVTNNTDGYSPVQAGKTTI